MKKKDNSKATIFLIEDDDDTAFLLEESLGRHGYEISRLKDGFEAVASLSKKGKEPHAIILDLVIPGRSGVELLGTIKSVYPSAKIFIYSGHRKYLYKIPENLIEGFFSKADDLKLLIGAINEALQPKKK